MVVRVFTNGLGDLGSIPGRVIPKTKKKWYLVPSCLTLSIIRYRSRVKWSDPEKGKHLAIHNSNPIKQIENVDIKK